MGWFVSRQSRWPDGAMIVEIAPGLDAVGADMLSDPPSFLKAGCGREYDDPVKAAEVAIAVRDLWATIAEEVRIEVGDGSMFILEEYPTDNDLIKWAREVL